MRTQCARSAKIPPYTPTRAAGALRSLGLQLIESPVTDVSSDDSQSVVCALQFMDEDDLVTSADETVSMASTDTDSSLYWPDPGRE